MLRTMKRSWRNAGLFLFALALLGGSLFGNRILALDDEAREDLRLYTELVSVAQERYGTEVAYRDLVYASIQGMLRSLDPHTSFLPPRAYSGMRERQQASFYGLGILVGLRNGQLTVITPIEGTPASQVGMRAGDVISLIEGAPTETMTVDEAVDKLKGPKGTKVHVTIVRRGMPEPIEMEVTRAEIPQNSVRLSYLLRDDVGYIQISDFNRSTGEEVARALKDLKAAGMERLVLDLRNNGGGLLDQAILVSDQFLPDGAKIVETRGRTRDSFQVFRSTDRYEELGMPVVVLVNRGTASAAEIVSGAIQDHDVGVVVGEPTWGKGLVQTVYNLSYGAGLALTTAKYYTPSGRLIQRDYTSFYDYYNYDPLAAGGDEAEAPEGVEGEPEIERGDVYYTDTGRKVYGGGGITPDVEVELVEIPEFAQYLLGRNAFFDFAVEMNNRNPVDDPAWQPPADLLKRFEEWLVREEVADAAQIEEGFAEAAARDFARLQIHAEVFNSTWGQEARHRVLTAGDAQIQEALEQLAAAGRLLANREKLEAEGRLGRFDSATAGDAEAGQLLATPGETGDSG
jgi:carboxyl-terminal processing protease